MTSDPRRGGRWRLRDDVGLRIGFDDLTAFGSPVSDRPSSTTRSIFARAVSHLRAHGSSHPHGAVARLLAEAIDGPAFDAIAATSGVSWAIRDHVLYPDPASARPTTLTFAAGRGDELTVLVDATAWPAVHECVAQLAHEGVECVGAAGRLQGALIERLLAHHLLCRARDGDGVVADDVTFIGHNAVTIDSGRTRLVVDPYLFSRSRSYPHRYQPLTLRELGGVDGVLITHSHPDHFDLASMLRVPSHVPIVVPFVERETLLTVDMARRLRELGFTNVVELDWGSSVAVGDMTVHALPFFGEQPTDGDVLHPEVRNRGNTYVVGCDRFRVALLADSGRDHLGDVRDVASKWASGVGPVDVVLSGYRGWSTYPPMHLVSSVAAFFLFAPPGSWSTRQRLMNDVDEAVDTAERFGATTLVPYGDGGAPWHWQIGLGAQLDGSGVEDTSFDPFPDRVVRAATTRVRAPDGTAIGSPVEVVLLHPGESLAVGGPVRPAVTSHAGHEWPYAS